MSKATYIYTVTVKTSKGRMFLTDYVNKPGVTITDEEIIEPEEEHRLTIEVTNDEYEISVIQEGLNQIDGVEIESFESNT